jgi:hypothetical protein
MAAGNRLKHLRYVVVKVRVLDAIFCTSWVAGGY